ncbi:MAG: cytochrome c biogenesis protein ResB [Bacteroidetes bacterium]|nr:cytochrome c biogenesis protein ResB [Bacteroidota bacterium]
MSHIIHLIYRFFRSTKLAIVLIFYGVVISIIGTILPQEQQISYYVNNYSAVTARLITITGADRITTSLFTIIPTLLFFINLLVCTVSRLHTRISHGAIKRFGPDILHLALILLIIGSGVSVLERSSTMWYLETGDTAAINAKYDLKLSNLEFLTYEDGRTRDWISTVSISGSGKRSGTFRVEVNRPLNLGKGKLYQFDYRLIHAVTLVAEGGVSVELDQGALISLESGMFQYLGNKLMAGVDSAQFREYGGASKQIYAFGSGDEIERFTVDQLITKEQTGLKYAEDPGAVMVFIALFLFTAGMALTIYQKMKDKKI